MVEFQRKDFYSYEDFLEIMRLLRAPGGCPWDREQTHQSIRRNMLEEAYEAVEAIDEEDPEHLKEELGDVLLQVVFHALMEQEAGRFDLDAVADAAMDGAASAVELSFSMAGILCLWSGVMEIMNVCGLSAGLARAFRPILRRLMPQASRDEKTLAALSANVSANLLGLGNAATPLGIEAARRMGRRSPGTASDAMCMLVVCNTASIQLIPTTVATVRSAAGSAAPFDILPAVWMSSALSVAAGLPAARLFSALGRRRA